MPWSMHQARFSITASGWVKSTATSAASAAALSSPRSRAATNCRSPATSTARHTSAPVRPRAPNTATFTSWATTFLPPRPGPRPEPAAGQTYPVGRRVFWGSTAQEHWFGEVLGHVLGRLTTDTSSGDSQQAIREASCREALRQVLTGQSPARRTGPVLRLVGDIAEWVGQLALSK